MIPQIFAILSSVLLSCNGQAISAPQTNTFNSSYALSKDQIQSVGINSTVANAVNIALNFERSNWATGSVDEDEFYNVPKNSSTAAPGSLLKVQQQTNTSLYTIAPNLALSRILFQTQTFNGSSVPASAYVLWPWMPRNVSGKYPVVAWGHGTSGTFGECGPSHIRNLWYQYSAPYILALQGYVVVAPDYAGLGVHKDANAQPIKHQYLAHQAAANDLFYAIEAARYAFPELSEKFVVMGHSQGGGAAWAAAHRQAVQPLKGYLGSIAASPATNFTDIGSYAPLAVAAGQMLSTIYPVFNVSEWLTPAGVAKLTLASNLGMCVSSSLYTLFAFEQDFFQPDWLSTYHLQAFTNLTQPGGRNISGPLLVLQGTSDPIVPAHSTDSAVNMTCAGFPEAQVQYVKFEGASHVPVLNAGQRIWLDWIADRFAGIDVAKGCSQTMYHPARATEAYQKDLNYFLEYVTAPYEVA